MHSDNSQNLLPEISDIPVLNFNFTKRMNIIIYVSFRFVSTVINKRQTSEHRSETRTKWVVPVPNIVSCSYFASFKCNLVLALFMSHTVRGPYCQFGIGLMRFYIGAQLKKVLG